MLDLNIIENFYKDMGSKINSAKSILDRPMTLTEKILYSHLNQKFIRPFIPGKSYSSC